MVGTINCMSGSKTLDITAHVARCTSSARPLPCPCSPLLCPARMDAPTFHDTAHLTYTSCFSRALSSPFYWWARRSRVARGPPYPRVSMAKTKQAEAAAAKDVPNSGTTDGKGDGPVVTAIQKRLRAAKKKLNRVAELEAKQAAGTALTEEQVPVVNSKPSVLAVIDELEKLAGLIGDAVKEEQGLVRKKAEEDALAVVAKREGAMRAEAEAEAAAAAARAEGEAAAAAAVAEGEARLRDAVAKLVQLIYFSTVRHGAMFSCNLC